MTHDQLARRVLSRVSCVDVIEARSAPGYPKSRIRKNPTLQSRKFESSGSLNLQNARISRKPAYRKLRHQEVCCGVSILGDVEQAERRLVFGDASPRMFEQRAWRTTGPPLRVRGRPKNKVTRGQPGKAGPQLSGAQNTYPAARRLKDSKNGRHSLHPADSRKALQSAGDNFSSWHLRVSVLRPIPSRCAASARRSRECFRAVRISVASNSRIKVAMIAGSLRSSRRATS